MDGFFRQTNRQTNIMLTPPPGWQPSAGWSKPKNDPDTQTAYEPPTPAVSDLPCCICGLTKRIEIFDGHDFPPICDDCEKQAVAENERKKSNQKRAEFLAGLPEDYRYASLHKVPARYRLADPATQKVIWQGKSGQGKSCAMGVAVAAQAKWYIWIDAVALHQLQIRVSTGREPDREWDRLSTTALLCIDDLHQAKWSPSFAEAFYALAEHRSSRRLATWVTCQVSAKALASKIALECNDASKGEAIERRIFQNALILT